MVKYQLNYGEHKYDPEKEEKPKPSGSGAEKKGEKSAPQWFQLDDDKNTHVYVSNLPIDINENEFVEFMGKCGLVAKDVVTGNWKVKMYKDSNGKFKGDATCTYIKVDSVNLALQILDSSYFKDRIVKVERAKFQMKGEYDASKKPKMKKKKDKDKIRRMQENLFSWKPEKIRGLRGKNERVVVVKHAFHPDEFETDVGLIIELKEDFKSEAAKLGEVKKIDLYDNNVEGALKIVMSTPEEADAVIQNFNGRFFGGRQLAAYTYDGHEKLHVVETEAEKERRIQKWSKYVEEEENSDEEKNNAKKLRLGEETPPLSGDVDSDDDKAYDDE